MTYKYLGKPRPLIEGMEKVTGYRKYSADLTLPNMLYARTVLSPYAHAKILSIDKSEAEALPGVVAVLTAQDLITRDRIITSRFNALLAKETVHWRGQPVVAVVAESDQVAFDAVEMVFVEYEEMPAIIDLETAIDPQSPTVWPNGLPKEEEDLADLHGGGEQGEETTTQPLNNVLGENHFKRGDVTIGFAESDHIVEHSYRIPSLYQAYLEPHAAVADPDPLGRGLTIYCGSQGQFFVRDSVARILGMPAHTIKIVPLEMGGGFGAKYGIIEPLAGAIALAVGKPVRLSLSRSDDFVSTMPAGGFVINLKTGVNNDGTVTALQARILLENGAFSFQLGGIAAMLIGGMYKWKHVQIDCYEVNTNKSQIGAYRAPGAFQTTFALESNIAEMAQLAGQDAFEFRLKNVVEDGDPTGVGEPWSSIGLRHCLEKLQSHPAWQKQKLNAHEGIGVAIGAWPGAVTPSSAICRVSSDGRVHLSIGAADISGVNSSFVLVAAEVLGVSPDEVVIVPGDSASNPFAPNAGGSQTTYSVTGAVRAAADEARKKLLKVAAEHFEAAEVDIELVNSQAQVKGVPAKSISIYDLASTAQSQGGGIGPISGEGDSAVAESGPGAAAHLVKVRVDPDTGLVTILQYVAVQDVGFALNPLLVEGQMHGAIVQGIGMALQEAMVYDESGQVLTGSFMDYAIPRAEDAPWLETLLVENPSPLGPFGTRGVGEPPIIPGAAAIANAVFEATGVRLRQMPLAPESIWQKVGQDLQD